MVDQVQHHSNTVAAVDRGRNDSISDFLKLQLNIMEKSPSKEVSSAEAVMLGALASGVNGATWSVLKITFLLLGICLIFMLSLAFISSDFIIIGNVLLLVIIAAVLFILLNGFLAQTGLVSVEQQMEEMGLSKNNSTKKDKEN